MGRQARPGNAKQGFGSVVAGPGVFLWILAGSEHPVERDARMIWKISQIEVPRLFGQPAFRGTAMVV